MGSQIYGIDDLAQLAGVSRRTIRYYVQEALLQTPHGLGRGRHYRQEHLDRLIRLRELQEQGLSLAEIRTYLSGDAKGDRNTPAAASAPVLSQEPASVRSLWRRITLAPGVELHVAGDVRLPPARRLHELSAWCRDWFRPSEEQN